MTTEKKIDAVTGVETTGHIWDNDLQELNKPLPKWWLYTFYATIIWAIGYWVAYPAWPMFNDYTKGVLGYSARNDVRQQVEAGKAAQAGMRDELGKVALGDVRNKPELLRFAVASGAAAFGTNCSPCHGRGAQGFVGYPNLNDDDWIWGDHIGDVLKTIQVGVRSDHKDTRSTLMPRFGADQILTPDQISDTAQHVLSLSGKATDPKAAGRGAAIFAEQCVACHGEKGTGNQELGAPNLSDAIWLYGGSPQDVAKSIETGRGGMMPAWGGRLDEVTIKSLAVYLQSLGGIKE